MKNWVKVLAATGGMLPFAVMAHSDVGDTGGHDHSKMSVNSISDVSHHTMHDQITAKSWEFYGALYMNLQSNDPGKAVAADGGEPARNLYLTSQGTLVGFRGAIPLNDNLKAVWQIESEINLDEFGEAPAQEGHGSEPPNYNDSVLAGSHNSFLGLSGDYGILLAGKHNTPFHDAVIQFDIFHHMPGDIRSVMGGIPGVDSGAGDHHGSTFNISAGDTIMYKSPNLNGFSFEGALFGLNETREKIANKSSAMGLAARYTQEMFTLVGAYEVHKNFDHFADDAGTATVDESVDESIDETKGMVFGGMLHLNGGDTMIGAFYEKLETSDSKQNDPDASTFVSDSRTGYYVNFQQRLPGGNKLKAAYAKAGEFQEMDGATSITVGGAHEVGAKTEIYLSYTKVDNEDEADYGTGSVGPLDHGGDPSTVSMGLVHMF